jgi:hypothetical protein
MCCGTRLKRLAAGVPASFVKEGAARTCLTGGFGSGDCSRVRPWLVRWLTVSGGHNLSQPSCPAFQSSCPADGYSAGRGLQPAPVRVPAAAHTERVNALLDACVRPKGRDAGRRALFGETSLHDAYTAISQIPIRFMDDRRDMTSKQLVNGGGA